MYSASFTQPQPQSQGQSQNHLHPTFYQQHFSSNVFPLQPQTLSPQQSHHLEYRLQDVHEPQYHSQDHHSIHHIPSYSPPHQQHSQSPTLPYPDYELPHIAAQYTPHQQAYEEQGQQHLFQVSRPFNHSSQYWPQHPPSEHHQIYSSPIVHSEVLSASSAGVSWSPVEYSDKDLIVSPKALNIHPLAVNPTQLQTPWRPVHAQLISPVTGGEDNESFEGTDEEDNEIRLQLSEPSHLLQSTPPLSPQFTSHGGLSQASSHMIDSFAILTTSSPTTSSPIPSLSAGALYAKEFGIGSYGYSDTTTFSALKIKEEDEEDKKRLNRKGSQEEEEEEEEEEKEEEDEFEEGEKSELRPFECEKCHKDFRRQYNLNAHLKTHTLKRDYACDECPKSFLRPYDLSRHQRIHTKDKPYKCRICSAIFIRNDAIWRHYRKHHKGHPDVPTSRRDKRKHCSSNTNIGALVTRVASATASSSRAKSASRKAKSKATAAAAATALITKFV